MAEEATAEIWPWPCQRLTASLNMDAAQTELPTLLAGMTMQGACAVACPQTFRFLFIYLFSSQSKVQAPCLQNDQKLGSVDVIPTALQQ